MKKTGGGLRGHAKEAFGVVTPPKRNASVHRRPKEVFSASEKPKMPTQIANNFENFQFEKWDTAQYQHKAQHLVATGPRQ